MVDDAHAALRSSLPLKPQELILSLVGEYVERGDRVWSGGLVRIMEDLDFTAAGARVALNRVVSRGLFDVVKDGRRVYYRATSRLDHLLAQGRRQTFWFRYPARAWDGQWTMVWYAVPEEHLLARRRFSRRLGFLGFSALHDGTWLAPYDRSEETRTAVEELGLLDYVVVFVGAAPEWLTQSAMLRHAWDLDEVARRYTAIIDEFGRYASPAVRARLQPLEAFKVRTFLIEAIRQVAPLDPKIPDSELGLDWDRSRAIDLFGEVETALRPAAQAYFTDLVDPHS
ncbi:MAG: PaaX family transcriptional regulator [Modestobacter sp.]|jgi:phenylacetic acid degradation operon negative regulatory protein|nr:PaaX family transcriptional regulator [Modestobacter sp.]